MTGVGAAAGAGALASAAPAFAGPRRAPKGFLWGTAISAYQSEGNNTNTDVWLLETLKNSVFEDRSGDACDSYDRYEEDIALAAKLGFNCYRMGIEWARIEPEPGRFSNAALDHYKRVLQCCRDHHLAPVVTFSHFTVPLWFAKLGGFEVADGADLFARYCARAAKALGPLMAMASTFNEANIPLLLRLLRASEPAESKAKNKAMIAEAVKATDSLLFSSLLFADADKLQPVLLDAHAKAYRAIKAAAPALPVGVTLSMQAVEGVGPNNLASVIEQAMYGGWIEAAKQSDWIGVQTYTRVIVDARGRVALPKDAEMTQAGYEFYPSALGATIRYAAQTIGKPLYVTESGIATDDDTRRIAFIDAAIAEVGKCIDEGIDVRGYVYWSLLDNFEWSKGYSQRFGLVAVDRTSFARTPKRSSMHLGLRAKANTL
ncbi:glycoside hydrolase family 1 protein [Sphingomonas sp. PAMC 26605]|uniref:glycoside hydrolase family 1 protein n=1 Tax=Sphingomonas sp. PAMC 26605 TaxID=1112214 RepID=UPI00026CD1F5|nr:family 1 glycosylhydrolase [Sphingomonas sp. PAMC 26605]